MRRFLLVFRCLGIWSDGWIVELDTLEFKE